MTDMGQFGGFNSVSNGNLYNTSTYGGMGQNGFPEQGFQQQQQGDFYNQYPQGGFNQQQQPQGSGGFNQFGGGGGSGGFEQPFEPQKPLLLDDKPYEPPVVPPLRSTSRTKARGLASGERLGQLPGQTPLREVLREIMGDQHSSASNANRILPQVQAQTAAAQAAAQAAHRENTTSVAQQIAKDQPPQPVPPQTAHQAPQPQHALAGGPATPAQATGQFTPQGPPQASQQPFQQPPTTPQAPSPVEMLDVDALLAGAGPIQPSPKETSHRIKYKQEREKREALLAQIQSLLLDRNEWMAREQFVQELSAQERQDFVERERLLEGIAKYENALHKLKRVQQSTGEEEVRKSDALKEAEQQLKHYRPQVTEKEAAIMDQHKYFEDKIAALTDAIRQGKQELKVVGSALAALQDQTASQSANEKNAKAALALASGEVDRLRKRIPVIYTAAHPAAGHQHQISGPVPPAPSLLPGQMSPTATSEGGGGDPIAQHFVPQPTPMSPPTPTPHTASPVGHRSSSVEPNPHHSFNSTSNREKRPVIGIEVRQVQGPDGETVKVIALSPHGPAEQAGVLVGDLITKVDGREIHSKPDFAAAILGSSIGSVLPVELLRTRTSQSGRITYYKEFTKVVVRSAKPRAARHK
eukprot:TRINITY_DN62935_c0_g2_i1.p1 TRINITY_DN62935_c0_g2~~TRINITY_DN62935_c0_g2_i1.p1  ORF type:complete len:688 (+),score=120.82 TRINITY_DN62935_c0_g2_i1:149-2065(+)